MKTTISTTINVETYRLIKLNNIKLNVALEKGVKSLLNQQEEGEQKEYIAKLEANIQKLQQQIIALNEQVEVLQHEDAI